jgi:mono/diheme cytochrome c family protein
MGTQTAFAWRIFAPAGVFGILLCAIATAPAAAQERPADHSAVIDTYCVACHNAQLKTADLELDSADIADPIANPPLWEKVIRKLRTGAMPPAGMPRPDPDTYDAVATYLETTLDRAAAADPDPGRPAIQRLNRTEYANAIRDLLAVDTNVIDIGLLLPADDSSYGFDNIGDVLTVSPVLMEGYLSAARKISQIALGDSAADAVGQTYEVPRFLVQWDRMGEDFPLGSRGGLTAQHYFARDGEYDFRIRLQRNGKTYVVGTEFPRRLDVRLDGEVIKQFTVGGDHEGPRPDEPSSFNQGDFERYLVDADEKLQFRISVKAGMRRIQLTFPNHIAEPEGIFQPPVTDYAYAWDYGHPDLEPAVASLTIDGPYNAGGIGETASRRRILVCTPAAAVEEEACARQILSGLARRAFRRPVTDADLQDLMSLYQTGRSSGGFEDGVRLALQRILVDPEFLFRIERDPPGASEGDAYQLSDLELASRLSFFLWSSIPDDRLLELAEQERLGEPEILEREVRRMLDDPRSNALVENFAGQWLYLRNVEMVWPNPDVYPDFDANLRQSLQHESALFFESVMREDRSVLDLLDADYTFLNERLARHYGVPNIYGSHFRRVSLSDENRRGLLGQGSILTVTSYATRTAPTIRGKWLLENILGAPPPPPPADVPSLDETTADENGEALTVREQMEMHRASPACASCHRVMDPLGFALENFDATGKWRDEDGGNPIDSSGVTPDGFALNGPADLREYLMSHPEQFVATTTEKLLTYALGRGVEHYDAPAIRKIIREAEPSDYRWSSVVLGIVDSTPFRMRRSE